MAERRRAVWRSPARSRARASCWSSSLLRFVDLRAVGARLAPPRRALDRRLPGALAAAVRALCLALVLHRRAASARRCRSRAPISTTTCRRCSIRCCRSASRATWCARARHGSRGQRRARPRIGRRRTGVIRGVRRPRAAVAVRGLGHRQRAGLAGAGRHDFVPVAAGAIVLVLAGALASARCSWPDAQAAPAPRSLPCSLLAAMAGAALVERGALRASSSRSRWRGRAPGAVFSCAGRATGVPLDLVTAVQVVPLVLAATTVPWAFAGWGVREASTAALYSLLGLDAATGVAVSVTFGLLSLVAAAPGVVVLALPRRSPHSAPHEPAAREGGAMRDDRARGAARFAAWMLAAVAVAAWRRDASVCAAAGLFALGLRIVAARGPWTPSRGFGVANALTLVRLVVVAALGVLFLALPRLGLRGAGAGAPGARRRRRRFARARGECSAFGAALRHGDRRAVGDDAGTDPVAARSGPGRGCSAAGLWRYVVRGARRAGAVAGRGAALPLRSRSSSSVLDAQPRRAHSCPCRRWRRCWPAIGNGAGVDLVPGSLVIRSRRAADRHESRPRRPRCAAAGAPPSRARRAREARPIGGQPRRTLAATAPRRCRAAARRRPVDVRGGVAAGAGDDGYAERARLRQRQAERLHAVTATPTGRSPPSARASPHAARATGEAHRAGERRIGGDALPTVGRIGAVHVELPTMVSLERRARAQPAAPAPRATRSTPLPGTTLATTMARILAAARRRSPPAQCRRPTMPGGHRPRPGRGAAPSRNSARAM